MLKTAVIGAGSMGRNHARIYAELQEAELCAIVDAHGETAQSIARQYGVPFYTDAEAMFLEHKLDAVSIAVPTPLHKHIAGIAMANHCHILLEKPIAQTIAEAEEILAMAQTSDIILTVGHIERFNPAVQQLRERLMKNELGALHYLEVRRQGPYPSRMSDIGVIIDLAVHDLDIVSFVTGSPIDRLYSETKCCLASHADDILSGVIRLKNGVIGSINVNWITPTKIRELYVTGEAGTFHVNYITQDLTFFQNAKGDGSTSWEAMGNLRGVSEGDMIRYQVRKEEPLRAEIRSFLDAVENGKQPPVSGKEAIHALRLAEMMVQSGREHSIITL